MRRGRKVHSKIALASIAALGCSAPTAAVSAPMAPMTTTSAAIVASTPIQPAAVDVAPQPAAGDPNPAPVIARVEAFSASNSPFEADVALEHFVKSHNVKKDDHGRLVFDRRGRFRLTFKSGNLLQADGGVLSVFDKANGIATQLPVAADHCPAALAFALAPGTIATHMGVQRFDGVGLNAPGLDVLLGTPRIPHPSVNKVLLYVRPTGEVPRMIVIPPNGDRLRLDFTKLASNVTPPSSLPLPASTQIVQASPTTNGATQSPWVATIP